ncbi:MAG TPA: hypothetical protein VNF45_06980 [Candidatus Binataceae bacterium]|nr:hypothetical protein [Candidatus Binataceae bacterium]
MAFKMDHAHERLSRAVAYLATRSGSLRERVLQVYLYNLSDLLPEEFDGDVRRDFEDLIKTFKGILDRTIRNPEPWNLQKHIELYGDVLGIAKDKIREKTAERIAKSIWDIYADVKWDLIEGLHDELYRMKTTKRTRRSSF